MSFFKMKVRTRLAMGFGIVLLVLLSVSAVGIGRLSALETQLDNALDFNTIEINLIAEAQLHAWDVSSSLRDVVPDVTLASALKKRVEQNLTNYEAIEIRLKDLFDRDPATGDEERQLLKQIVAQRTEAFEQVRKVEAMGVEEDPGVRETMTRDADPAIGHWLSGLQQFRDQKMKTLASSSDNAHHTYNVGRSVMLVLSVLAVVVAGAVCVATSRSILGQLGGEPDYAASIAESIARGDLTVSIEATNANRSSLLSSMKLMRDQLRTAVGQIRASTDSIATASKEISNGNSDLSMRTERQAASLEQTAASMTQLSETVKQNADNARQASALAMRATDVADNGAETVQTMVSTIENINESSKKVSEITGVIEGIAFQTNILALNAAVEAARAGELGRGFAVVASEVRNLAQRSAAAAKEIKELIGLSVAMIIEGAQQAGEARATMGHVKQSIRQVSDIVGEIAAASDEQSKGVDQINQAVQQMDEVTQQNAALVEQAAAATQSLEDLSFGLKDSVAVFRLGHG